MSKKHSWYISPKRRLAILERDNWACRYCGATLSAAQILEPCPYGGFYVSQPEGTKCPTLDHIISKSQGGSHKSENLVAACNDCNARKGTKALADFVTVTA